MSKNFDCVVSEKNSPRFPFRKVPQTADKFPFRDVKHYINPEDDEVNSKVKILRFGYVAQRSINYLESTGRKPNLDVPWFKGAVHK